MNGMGYDLPKADIWLREATETIVAAILSLRVENGVTPKNLEVVHGSSIL
jgi:hypothetical protein